MNYKKLYTKLIDYCLQTTPKERLINRNSGDIRINKEHIYTELHHINPKHDKANTNDELVELLPEEHILAHQIRWKAFKMRGDMLAVRFCLNGFQYKKNERIIEAKMENKLNKAIKQGYIWVKQNSFEVRTTHGWHSPDGLKRIAEARKGHMPARDMETMELIGHVPVNHPNVLSGKWAHHMKGRKLSPERAAKCASPGEKNGRHSGYTDIELLDITRKYIIENGSIDKLFHSKYPKFPKSFSKCRFPEFDDKSGLRRFKMAYKERFNDEYPKYIKTEEHRKKLSQANKGKKRKLISED